MAFHVSRMENRTPPIRGSVINSLGIEVLGYIGALVSPALPEREFPVSVWYAFEKEKRKIALTREKQKHPKAKKKNPKSTKTPPKDEKNTPFFSRLRAKKTALFQKTIGFAGQPRTPATPGIPRSGLSSKAAVV